MQDRHSAFADALLGGAFSVEANGLFQPTDRTAQLLVRQSFGPLPVALHSLARRPRRGGTCREPRTAR